MLGAILGDIIGSRFEFTGFKGKEFQLFNSDCNITDDSLMTLAVAKTLDESINNLSDIESLKERAISNMVKIFNDHPNTNWGETFYNWLTKTHKPYKSFGNGAAMRISPVGWISNSEEQVKVLSKALTEISHNHPEGIKGAEAISMCIYLARTKHDKDFIKDYVINNYYKDLAHMKFDVVCKNYGDLSMLKDPEEFRFYVSCEGSVPYAILAFLESNDFVDAIRNAISLGGDSDTLACMAGAIAEAYYGVDRTLEDKMLEYLSNDLQAIYYSFDYIAKYKK